MASTKAMFPHKESLYLLNCYIKLELLRGLIPTCYHFGLQVVRSLAVCTYEVRCYGRVEDLTSLVKSTEAFNNTFEKITRF